MDGLLVGKGFLDSIMMLVGAAVCPAFWSAALRWTLAIMLSADQGLIKTSQSQCCNVPSPENWTESSEKSPNGSD